MRVKRLGAIALGSSQEIDVFVTDQIIDEQPAIEIVSTGKLHYMEPRAKYYWSKFELEVEKAAWAPVALAMLAAYLRTGTELAKALAEYRDELEPILEEYRDMVRADLDDARGTDSIFYKLALVIRAREKRSCGSTTCSESRAVKAGP